MEIVIITGLSGSGKSKTIGILEDIGFFCVDNLPPKLISKFVQIGKASKGNLDRIAIVTDIRGGQMFSDIFEEINCLDRDNVDYKILFLDANYEILKRRFSETRRKHPLIGVDNCFNVMEAIEKEKKLLYDVKSRADYVIDTSQLTNSQLKERISKLFLEKSKDIMMINFVSFGFKHGDITCADLVFDVRCLPNPYYIDSLRFKTGLDKEVRDYVVSFDESNELIKKLEDLIEFLVPLYIREGKSQLTIAFGCTGGMHRSVTFAEIFYKKFLKNDNKVSVSHRDMNKK